MGESDDVDDESLELLHATAEQALRRQVESFKASEAKIWRHVALLGAFVGAFAVGLPEAISTFRSSLTASAGALPVLFGLSYITMLAFAFSGMVCLALALRWEVLWVDPIEPDFFEKYSRKEYRRILVALTKGALNGLEKNKTAITKKERWSRKGYQFLMATVAVTGLTLIFYLGLKLS